MAGQLSLNVRKAIESRLKVLSRGAAGSEGSFTRFRGVPPLLSCDFVLEFWYRYYSGLEWNSTDYMLTDLNGVDGTGLSWSPDSHDGLVPLPDVKVQYFTVQFYVSESLESAPTSFPTLYFYEQQFTSDGLLRVPGMSTMDGFKTAGGRWVDSQASSNASSLSGWRDLLTSIGEDGNRSEWEVAGVIRPNITLHAVFRNEAGERERLGLCHFMKCTFGTPHQSFAVGQTGAMQWTQQIGFQDVIWGNKSRYSYETFWDRAKGMPVSPPMVKPFRE